MNRDSIFENVRIWKERIGNASAKWGGCEICAVTKTQDAETINLAWEAGLTTIGENRVQELTGKIEGLNPSFNIHLIGALQTNKVKYIADKVDLIQSVDRIALADEISRRALAVNRKMDILLQVNIARESQKSGIDEDDLMELVRHCSALEGVHVKGLMAIMPLVENPEEVRPYFKRMRGWFDRLKDESISNVDMDILSMGMSGDCIAAAEEGATMVRLGRAIFGARH